MDYKMIRIFDKKVKVNNNKYEFIIDEKWIDGWGYRHNCGRVRPKFYSIKKNGKDVLHTSVHQTYNAMKRKILNEVR